MIYNSFTHVGFSDESHWNQRRYRSLALISGELRGMNRVDAHVKLRLQESGIKELSWSEVRSAKAHFAATKVCDLITEMVRNRLLRVDVLTWDTEDSRHKIARRDDTQNLARMYYHLFSNVVTRRWDPTALWRCGVDERTDMNWQELQDCLSGQTRHEKSYIQPGLPLSTAYPRRPPPRVEQVSSSEETLVQAADLFAGLGAFSWNQQEEHSQWMATELPLSFGQQTMFSGLGQVKISKSASYKHELLHHFASLNARFVQMKSQMAEGLRTYRPDSPMNFWLYVPQHLNDKAPKKFQFDR